MIPTLREHFNREWTQDRYHAYVAAIEKRTGVHVEFPLSETPCFFPASLMERLISVSHEFLHQLLDNPEYLRAAHAAVPDRFRVHNAEPRPTFICVDFGLIATDHGVEGRLVELQAFASLFGFQMALADTAIEAYGLKGLTPFFGGLDRDEYLRIVGRTLKGDHDPVEVVLMDINPDHQKTRPDFVVTEQLWGVRAVDASSVTKVGRQLFYRRDGRLVPIRRIYNRVIPDELEHKGLRFPFDYRDNLDVEWAGGPDWYFALSKFAIPWLKHPWVPRTQYLHDVREMPADRERCLLKPLFSFAGGGIIFAPTDEQIAAIPAQERHLFLLQERLAFTPVIQTPYGPTQAEVRIMMVREGDRYRALVPLVRMGRGKMMGVDHNKGLKWVGAAAGLMPT